jgi:Protein of unknown function (DUF664)
MNNQNHSSRRSFIKYGAVVAAGVGGALPLLANPIRPLPGEELPNVLGPREGYSAQMDTLVSMMTWMRRVILSPVKGMTVEQLDYLHDANANTIGGMLFHLAATERYYQLHTLDGREWGDFPKEDIERFGAASELGDVGRAKIKGNKLEFYTDILKEVREGTLSAFKKKDDAWLMSIDKNFPWGPTNNYCKWFHVCEHESNHNGQIKWIKSRIPGMKAAD